MSSPKAKLLVIRFSSFGDVIQAVSVPYHFSRHFEGAEVHWLVREDFSELLTPQPQIARVIAFSRKLKATDLVKLSWSLTKQNYTHVYDAHNNLRSQLVVAVFFIARLLSGSKMAPFSFIRRSKHRFKRFLLFRMGINKFETPFIASLSFLTPLEKWGIEINRRKLLGENRFQVSAEAHAHAAQVLQNLSLEPLDFTTLVPSAAWKMKRWPALNWKRLIEDCPFDKFIILGGPEDHFCKEIAAVAPERVFNLCGELTLIESCAILELSNKVVSNDTGLLHVADQMQTPALALIGPTAFGFPSSQRSVAMRTQLWCQPCSKDGRGKCRNEVYQKCLLDLRPDLVAEKLNELK